MVYHTCVEHASHECLPTHLQLTVICYSICKEAPVYCNSNHTCIVILPSSRANHHEAVKICHHTKRRQIKGYLDKAQQPTIMEVLKHTLGSLGLVTSNYEHYNLWNIYISQTLRHSDLRDSSTEIFNVLTIVRYWPVLHYILRSLLI